MHGEIMRYAEHAPHTEGEGARAIADALDRLRDEIGQRHTENTSSLEVIEKDIKVLTDRVDDLTRGFPNGDPDGHRLYHEASIKRIEARTRFYEALRAELAKQGVWSLIVFLGAAIVYYIKSKLMDGR